MLWRQGVAVCPSYCALDAADDRSGGCSCSCPEALVSEFLEIRGLWNASATADARAEAVLVASGVLGFNPLFGSRKWLAHGLGDYASLLDLLCEVGTPGEMFTSAAPYDPAFWPLHGLADRALASRRADADATSFDETWGYAHGLATVASDTHLVCDWTAVDSGDARLPKCATGTCDGHRDTDMLPFTIDGRAFSNAGFYAYMAPDNADFPYVYDALS